MVLREIRVAACPEEMMGDIWQQLSCSITAGLLLKRKHIIMLLGSSGTAEPGFREGTGSIGSLPGSRQSTPSTYLHTSNTVCSSRLQMPTSHPLRQPRWRLYSP